MGVDLAEFAFFVASIRFLERQSDFGRDDRRLHG